MSSDGNITFSTLTFTPTLADHGKTLTCRAVNEHIDAAVEEDSWKLNVFCKYRFVCNLRKCSTFRTDLTCVLLLKLHDKWGTCILKQLGNNGVIKKKISVIMWWYMILNVDHFYRV